MSELISVVQEPPIINKEFVDGGYPGFASATLSAGDKVVTLKIEGPVPDLGSGSLRIIPRIDRVQNASRIPGATTAIYVRVREVMEELATIYQKPVAYTFHTDNPNMSAWAQDASKGEGIFNWDSVITKDGKTVCTTVIQPLIIE